MVAVYPTAVATTTDLPDIGANLGSYPHDDAHNEMRDEIIALEAELGPDPSGSYASVKARLDAGWQPIASASVSAVSTFDITIPSSTYRMVRLFLWGHVAAGGPVAIRARVNNDSTAGLHSFYVADMSADSAATGIFATQTEFQIGYASTVTNAYFSETIFGATDGSSNVPYKSNYTHLAATEADFRHGFASGRLTANRTISSLRILPTSSTFGGTYVCEGYKAP